MSGISRQWLVLWAAQSDYEVNPKTSIIKRGSCYKCGFSWNLRIIFSIWDLKVFSLQRFSILYDWFRMFLVGHMSIHRTYQGHSSMLENAWEDSIREPR